MSPELFDQSVFEGERCLCIRRTSRSSLDTRRSSKLASVASRASPKDPSMRAKDRQKPSFFTMDEVCMRFSLDRGIYSYLVGLLRIVSRCYRCLIDDRRLPGLEGVGALTARPSGSPTSNEARERQRRRSPLQTRPGPDAIAAPQLSARR